MSTKAQDFKAKKKAFNKTPHRFDKRICHWFYCSGCGLVALKNEATRKRMAQSCESMEE